MDLNVSNLPLGPGGWLMIGAGHPGEEDIGGLVLVSGFMTGERRDGH
jgi:hypothetical protein